MGRASREKDDTVEAARYFITRAQEAIEAAEAARTDEAHAAFYREAETWLYMANRCLRPDIEAPPRAPPPPRRVAPERRSFGQDH